jgi:hypothetical protein
MRKILKGAVVLLIAVAMIFSTTAVTADTEEQMNPEFLQNTNPKTIVNTNVQPLMGPVIFEQLPIDENGNWIFRTSAAGPAYRVHDNFPPLEDEICDIHWWGLSLVYDNGWADCDPTGMVFEIIFWDSLLGQVICGPYQVQPTATGTGQFFAGFEMQYWETELEPCCSMPEGGWVSIQSIDSPNNCWFLWAGSEDGDLYCYQEGSATPDQDSDCAFQLTKYGDPCDPCIDVEKYVWDEKNQDWVDADTQDEAIDIKICKDVTFKITIKNCGDVDLTEIMVMDKMHDSLKFISGDPEPDEYYYEEPFWYINWFIPIIPVGGVVDIFITAHVEGPECSYDFNYVLVEGNGCGKVVRDEDYAWVHAHDKAKEFNTPILNFLESHPNMFPLLQILLQRLGLF